MKKFILILSLVAGIIIAQILITSKTGAAATTPYDNNRNFAYIESHMGISSYLDLRTVKILRNDPPYYMISGDVIQYNIDHNRVYETLNITHFYNAISYETYTKNKYTNNDWSKDNVKLDSNRRYADSLFKAAFGKDFYGKSFGFQKNGRFANVKNIAYSRMALGGIQLGSTKDRVRSIYGNSNNVKAYEDHGYWNGYVEEWIYGDSFKVIFVNGHVLYINSSAKNGIKTPDGISVGDDIRKLYRTYGTAKRIAGIKGGISYIYYNDINDVNMYFGVIDDKITVIGILIE